MSVLRKRFLGNYWSHHHQAWHGDCLRHENASLYWPWPAFKVTQILIMKIINVLFFINCSSNAHQVRCEDSPLKCLYNLFSVRWPCSSLKVTTVSQTWQFFLTCSIISISRTAMAFTLATTVDLFMTYMLMLVPITLTLMQGHSRSAKAKYLLNYLDN